VWNVEPQWKVLSALIALSTPHLADKDLAEGLGQLSGALYTARSTVRILGIPDYWWLFTISTDQLSKAKWLSMFFYQIFDNMAFIGSFAPKLSPALKEKANYYSMISCRLWFVFIAIGMVQDMQKPKESKNASADNLKLTKNCADLVQAYAYGVESSPIPGSALSLLSLISGLISLKQSFIDTYNAESK
jgi:hypothetical protein